MSRPIRFRAWQLDAMGNGPYMVSDCAAWTVSELNAGGAISVMQYTGLKDKNGDEICEGDIVVDTKSGDKKRQEVRWYRGGFMLQTEGHFGFHNIERYDGDCKHFEVIGNIYENPELLK